jgi:hypothetical protein
MPVLLFDDAGGDDEARYLSWLHAHPQGFVVNVRRRQRPGYAVLHRASCTTIRTPTRSVALAPFTGEAYVKACAETEAELAAWVVRRLGVGFSKRCTLCAA